MMKYIFLAVVFLHGTIHLMGFLKAFKLAELDQLKDNISKISGIFWLLTFLFFLLAGVAYLTKADDWFRLSFIGVFLSTILIISAWKDAKFGTVPNIFIALVAIIGYGSANFSSKYENEVEAGLKQTALIPESLLTEIDISSLPENVKNYIRYTGFIGKPKVYNFKVEFEGKIRDYNQTEWMPICTEQYNFQHASTRLFFMKAVMKHLPVTGFHCFKNGDAFMDIRLLSLFKVQYMSGKEMGIAETVTFFNDMCCMAPASLIDKRIKWLENDNNKVKAEFTNNGITISAWLYFNDKGELINFISDDRYAAGENNTMMKLQWSTPLKDYKIIEGYKLASYGEAIYSYPDGDFCYGTFRLTNVKYNTKE